MKLLIIFINHEPNIRLVWQKGLHRVWQEKHKACLVSVDAKDPSSIRLYSINRDPNTTKDLKSISSLDQLVDEAKKFMTSFDQREIVFLKPEDFTVKLTGNQSGFRTYDCVGSIFNIISEKDESKLADELKVSEKDESKLADELKVSEKDENKLADELKVTMVSQPITTDALPYPSGFKLAYDRKTELENELKSCCWLSRANKARTLNELDFWKEVLAYSATDPFATLNMAVEHVKGKYETEGRYTKVTNGSWCCKTKSASLIKQILTKELVPEEVELLAPVVVTIRPQ